MPAGPAQDLNDLPCAEPSHRHLVSFSRWKPVSPMSENAGPAEQVALFSQASDWPDHFLFRPIVPANSEPG